MKITFNVTVTISRKERQSISEFEKEDAKAMKPYLMGQIMDAVKDAWQYNAVVTDCEVTVKKGSSKKPKTKSQPTRWGPHH